MTMRFIPTKVHGMLDYVTGTLMSTSPLYLKGLKKDSDMTQGVNENISMDQMATMVKKAQPRQIIPMAMGTAASVYSLFTNYELGAVKKIPMRVHLALDALSGAFMAAAPWIFGFYKKSWVPFVAMGVFEIGAALFTQLDPSYAHGEVANA